MSGTPRVVDDLIWRETNDGIVIVDPQAGQVRVLNGVGSEIWKLVSQNQAIADIRKHIVAEFEVSDSQAENDLNGFLNDLVNRGLVVMD